MALTPEVLRQVRALNARVGNLADDATRINARAWVRAWADLETQWTDTVADLARQAQAQGAWISPSTLARERRLRESLSLTRNALDALITAADLDVQEAARAAVAETALSEPLILASQLPPEAIGSSAIQYQSKTSVASLTAIVERSATAIHALHLPLPEIAISAIKARLVRGVAVGDNPNKVAAGMVADLRGAFDLPLSRATTIARTEILDAYREASRVVHAANSDVVAGWRWHCQLDKRSCPACWSKHGTLYPPEQPGPWDHQQGRCSRAPELKSWAELGIPGKEPQSALPDAQVVFGKLSKADQVAIMGKERLAALDAGTAKWSDLATRRSQDGWRDSYAPTPVSFFAAGRD